MMGEASMQDILLGRHHLERACGVGCVSFDRHGRFQASKQRSSHQKECPVRLPSSQTKGAMNHVMRDSDIEGL